MWYNNHYNTYSPLLRATTRTAPIAAILFTTTPTQFRVAPELYDQEVSTRLQISTKSAALLGVARYDAGSSLGVRLGAPLGRQRDING